MLSIFSINEKNESISVRVTDFQPRFYVNIPKSWNSIKIKLFINTLNLKQNSIKTHS